MKCRRVLCETSRKSSRRHAFEITDHLSSSRWSTMIRGPSFILSQGHQRTTNGWTTLTVTGGFVGLRGVVREGRWWVFRRGMLRRGLCLCRNRWEVDGRREGRVVLFGINFCIGTLWADRLRWRIRGFFVLVGRLFGVGKLVLLARIGRFGRERILLSRAGPCWMAHALFWWELEAGIQWDTSIDLLDSYNWPTMASWSLQFPPAYREIGPCNRWSIAPLFRKAPSLWPWRLPVPLPCLGILLWSTCSPRSPDQASKSGSKFQPKSTFEDK